MKTLIVLFGNENWPEGWPKTVAVERCRAAIALLKNCPDAAILPTGGFGDYFNVSDRPHWQHLATFLLDLGASPRQILAGTNSNGTLEDVLCLRREILDRRCFDVHIVSSDYHLPRVKYIVERLIPEIRAEYYPATSPQANVRLLQKDERKSFDRLRKEWVLGPLYSPGAAFPSDVYSAAGNDQRHYDSLSLAVVSSIMVVAGYAIAERGFPRLVDPVPSCLPAARAIAAIVIIIMLCVLYVRLARWARKARAMARFIELGFNQPGFSANVYTRKRRVGRSVVTWVVSLTVLLSAGLAAWACVTLKSCSGF